MKIIKNIPYLLIMLLISSYPGTGSIAQDLKPSKIIQESIAYECLGLDTWPVLMKSKNRHLKRKTK